MQPFLNFLQQFFGYRGFLFSQLDVGKELRDFLDGHARDLADVLARDLDLLRFDAEASAAACRARRVSAITAEKDAHMQLVLLAFEMIEEATYAQELALAFDDCPALLGIEFSPSHIERNIRLLGKTLQLGKQRAVFGLGPGFNSALIQGFRFVRYHQIEIKIDGVAETLAARAGAIRVVEGKQARLGLFVPQVARLAFEAL